MACLCDLFLFLNELSIRKDYQSPFYNFFPTIFTLKSPLHPITTVLTILPQPLFSNQLNKPPHPSPFLKTILQPTSSTALNYFSNKLPFPTQTPPNKPSCPQELKEAFISLGVQIDDSDVNSMLKQAGIDGKTIYFDGSLPIQPSISFII